MKDKIVGIILIVLALGLIVFGAIMGYDKDTTVEKEPVSGYVGESEDYTEIGAQSLKEDQVFDNIKYTQNHLSTTDASSYASFTSVIYNETDQTITHQHLEIDFYDATGKLLGTMESSIEDLAAGASTVIYGIAEYDFSTAETFTVRQVTE